MRRSFLSVLRKASDEVPPEFGQTSFAAKLVCRREPVINANALTENKFRCKGGEVQNDHD